MSRSLCQNTEWCCRAKRQAGVREGRTLVVAVSGTHESPKREVLRSVLPEWVCCFPGRAAESSGKQLTHRPEGQMGAHRCQGQPECGVPRWTPRRAPRLCRVGRGRDSQETAAQSSVSSPGRMRRASARESPCQTAVVGDTEWQQGVGSRCPLG